MLSADVLSVQVQDGSTSSNEAFLVVTVQAGDLMPTADCGGAGRIKKWLHLMGQHLPIQSSNLSSMNGL